MIKVIKTAEIEDGMILAYPVLNGFRQMLLPAGLELNRKHLTVLKTWNVLNVSISIGEVSDKEELPQELIENSREMVLKNLTWCPRNVFEDDLINMATIKKAKTSFLNGVDN